VEYLAVAAIVFALNLLPAFGPPTSAVLRGSFSWKRRKAGARA